MTIRRQALSAEAATGLGAAIVVLVLVTGIELGSSQAPSASGWFAIAPFLAAAFAPWRYVVGVGVVACDVGIRDVYGAESSPGTATCLLRLPGGPPARP